MEEKLYTLVSTGLLALIALLLLVVVSGIARVERALKRRPGEAPADSGALESAPSVDGAVASALAGPAPDQPQTSEADAPFEQDGRWWYRSGGELLVYDEQTESWVLPSTTTPDTESWAVPSSTTASAEPEPHPLDEARGWDTTPREETSPQETTAPAETTTPEDATAAPIPEPVAEPEPITGPAVEEEAAQEQPAAPAGEGTHWKCPACGVINGSTATSCRMCFAARP